MLVLLAQSPDRVFSRDEFLQEAWGEGTAGGTTRWMYGYTLFGRRSGKVGWRP